MRPSREFTIKILPPEDFEKLPYPRAKEALGMSVMKTKTAYIKSTGVAGLDRHTIDHEFDELMQSVSPHEENGIRYKIPILGPIITAIKAATISASTGGAFSGLSTAAKIGAGLGKIAAVAAPAVATAAATQGINRAIAGGQQQGGTYLPGFSAQPQYTPSAVTQAFAPGATSPQPLGKSEFDKAMERLRQNAAAQKSGVFAKFRGLGTTAENTAFANSLQQAEQSATRAREQFLEEQRKLGSTFA